MASLRLVMECDVRVFALPTQPGFGRSEKPALQYTQYLWRDVLVDFIRAVVQRPVVVAGNSIGGFQSAMLAGEWCGRASTPPSM